MKNNGFVRKHECVLLHENTNDKLDSIREDIGDIKERLNKLERS
jgi:hypothetical protein